MGSFRNVSITTYFLRWRDGLKNISSSKGGKWSVASFAVISALGVADAIGYKMKASFFSFTLAFLYLCLPGLLTIRYKKIESLLDDCASLGNRGVLFISIYAFIATYLFEETFPKRVAFFAASAPLFLPLLLRLCRKFISASQYNTKVVCFFLGMTLFMLWFPGGYLPPFYNGIAGWKFNANESHIDMEKRTVPGLQLVNEDGQRQWFSYGIVSPINFVMRHHVAFNKNYPENIDEIYSFYFKVYCHNFHLLRSGYYPNQRYLGSFSYPGHTPYVKLEYQDFEPKNIASLELVAEVRSVKTKIVEKRFVQYSYDVPDAMKNESCGKNE